MQRQVRQRLQALLLRHEIRYVGKSAWTQAHRRWRPVVEALQALRGVQVLHGVRIVAELGDFQRFESPRKLMAYLGLIPSEDSSGALILGDRAPANPAPQVARLLTALSHINVRREPRAPLLRASVSTARLGGKPQES